MSEVLVDVIDEQGDKTGQVVSRSKAHAEGILHRTVHVWIINQAGEVLIARRAPEKETNPNKWGVSSVAGHVRAGEEPIAAAIAEVQEEINVQLEKDDFEHLYTTPHWREHHGGSFITNHLDESYLVQREIDMSALVLQEGEVSEVALKHFSELEQALAKSDTEFAQHEEYDKLFPILYERYRARST